MAQDSLKRLYHGLVPAGIRNPIGQARRGLKDRWQRPWCPGALPPRELLLRVQMTPWVAEYLEVGRRAAASLRAALEAAGFGADRELRLLDLGCGTARITRHLLETCWTVHGCDVDGDAIAWAHKAIPDAQFAVNDSSPPLPYEEAYFDVIVAVSVFTHFPAAQQRAWGQELARLLADDSIAIVSTMGPPLLDHFSTLATAENRAALDQEGFLFHRAGPSFNEAAAFHAPDALAGFFAPRLELERWIDKGLDSFQDLSVLRRSKI